MNKLIATIATVLLLAGCGPHWNMSAKPYEQPKQIEPAVQATPAPAAQPAAPAVPPDKVTLTLPNWPAFVYQQGEAFVLLVVKDPKSFPIPKEIVFKGEGDKTITMPLTVPDKPRGGQAK